MPRKLETSKETALFFIVFIAAAIVYCYNLTYSDIWIDEAFTKALVKHPLPRVFGLLAGDFHPPLYFLSLKLFTSVVGVSDFTIRFFSVLGVLCTLALGYGVGQRLFGKTGALYFCLLILAIPMLASHARNARMYTWASFAVTGVFLYAGLFMKTKARRDLLMLGLFTLMAAYLHYYALMAAFWANLYVFIVLLIARHKMWRSHLVVGLTAVALYLPWLLALHTQMSTARREFWIQPVNLQTVLLCYIEPFAKRLWSLAPQYLPMYVMAMLVYGLTLAAVVMAVIKRNRAHGRLLGLALTVFNATILSGIVLSLVFRPILHSRYITTLVVLLMLGPTLFLLDCRGKLLKGMTLAILLGCGLYTSLEISKVSMGPYRQSLEYLHATHPEIKKIVHVSELTTGSLLEHNHIGDWEHYWVKSKEAVNYTNIQVFDELIVRDSLGAIVTPGEVFCLADIAGSPLNHDHIDTLLSQCQVLEKETVEDRKSIRTLNILLYTLQYRP